MDMLVECSRLEYFVNTTTLRVSYCNTIPMSQLMLSEMRTAHTHLIKGLEVGRGTSIPSGHFDRVVLCGMGGSALAAELIRDYVKGSIEFETCHDYLLPEGATPEDTLIIASSYSGNTEETISALQDAFDNGFSSVVMAHGGRIAQMAKDMDLPYFEVPEAIQPRCAIGYGMGILLGILEQMDVLVDQYAFLKQTEDFIAQEIEEIERIAKTNAALIKGSVPIVYGGPKRTSLARITKIHFNENAKTQSFFAELPEMNHNEMVGYTNLVMKPTILLIRSVLDYERVTLRMDTMKKVLGARNIPFIDLSLKGEDWLSETYYGLVLAYLMSYYLALEYGVDPTPVDMVEEFKVLLV